MDSSIVSREIRREIWPALRKEGFDQFSSRMAWRRRDARIWVVNFQSIHARHAEVQGYTPFSFTVQLGIYVSALGGDTQAPVVRPKDRDCHLHSKLSKTLEQPDHPHKDIWYVDPIGGNVLFALDDARTALRNEGMRWFQRFEDNAEVLRALDEEGAELLGKSSR